MIIFGIVLNQLDEKPAIVGGHLVGLVLEVTAPGSPPPPPAQGRW